MAVPITMLKLLAWGLAHRRFMLWAALALAGASVVLATRLRFQNDVEFFFPEGDEDFEFLRDYSERLSPEDLFLLVGIEEEGGIMQREFLIRLDSFSTAARRLPYVRSLQSITNFQDVLFTSMGPLPYKPIGDLESDSSVAAGAVALRNDPRVLGNLLSVDGKATNIIMTLERQLMQPEAERLVHSFDSLTTAFGFGNVRTAGVVTTQVRFVNQTIREMSIYTGVSIIVLLAALIITYRRGLGVLVPFLTVLLGLILFLGTMGAASQKLDLMSPLYPILMLIFGISGVIHVQTRYVRLGRLQHDGKANALRVWKDIGLAVFLCSFTTAIGFIALVNSPIRPVRQFGLWGGFGVMLAFLLIVVFTLPLLSRIRPNALEADTVARKGKEGGGWAALARWLDEAGQRKGLIWAAYAVFALAGIQGLSTVSTNTYLLDDLPRDDATRKDFDFFEKHFGAVRTYEVAVMPKAGLTAWSPSVVRALDTLEQELISRYPINNIVSPVLLLKSINKAQSGQGWAGYHISGDDDSLKQQAVIIRKFAKGQLKAIATADGSLTRLAGRIRDMGSDSIAFVNNYVRSFAASHAHLADFRITGAATLVDKNHKLMRTSLLEGLGLAFLIICVTLTIVYRNWRAFVITIVPNILPLILAGAVMGWFGISLRASTSIIFSVSYGVAVNNTIHFLNLYLKARRRGEAHRMALTSAFNEGAKAIILSSIFLMAGFISLLFSSFTATYYIGLLTLVTVFAAMLADLFVAPALIEWLYRGVIVKPDEGYLLDAGEGAAPTNAVGATA